MYILSILSLSAYQYAVILGFLYCLWLTFRIGKRLKQSKGTSLGCIGFGYVFLVVGCITTFALTGLLVLGDTIYDKTRTFTKGDKYEAVYYDYTSYESYDSESGRTSTMYTPIIRFTTAKGQLMEKTLNYSSSSRPIIGNKVTVYFDADRSDIAILSFGIIAMTLGVIFFFSIIIFLFIGVTMYAMGHSMKRYKQIATYVGINMLVPLLMVLFDGLLIYVLFDGEEKPIWVNLVVGFFALVMTLSIWAYIKSVVGKEIKWVKTGVGTWRGEVVEKSETKTDNDLFQRKEIKYKQRTSQKKK
ncbi:DUF3592 domain-containing protein [Myroides phaeus]|uniref:DUF3592 domain-containing protein n=1 Tax=Myroides phaeus TaxID=702745 RepID=UPI002DB7A74B|nr:DUF3592 domain-containing protein [Myroides phaeus]MEC4115699.1 DUF3592 domain-containing protein [Myroides phaeus]